MNRETLIYGDKTSISTDFYLHLLSCEEREKRLIKYLEDKIKKLEEKINIFYETYIDKDCPILEVKLEVYKNILERVKSGKYE